jgi:hypothetical protein
VTSSISYEGAGYSHHRADGYPVMAMLRLPTRQSGGSQPAPGRDGVGVDWRLV